MLKVVVFDSGYGGELFAERLAAELPVIDVIKVIDWRNAEKMLHSPRTARRVADKAIRAYVGKVDLIVLANHLLTLTSLGYFRRKYREQRFAGFQVAHPGTFLRRRTVVLTTRAVAWAPRYGYYLLRMRRRIKTVCLDSWPSLIDDGELTDDMVKNAVWRMANRSGEMPEEIILACGQFSDIEPSLRKAVGRRVKIYDSFNDTMTEVYKALNIRGRKKRG